MISCWRVIKDGTIRINSRFSSVMSMYYDMHASNGRSMVNWLNGFAHVINIPGSILSSPSLNCNKNRSASGYAASRLAVLT